MRLDRRTVMAGLMASAAPGGKALAAPAPAKRPNIVLLLGEGLRWDEFGFAGNTILKTPNIDRIAREGARFRNAFCTNALCLPSRASFLTGAWSHYSGAVTNDADVVPPTSASSPTCCAMRAMKPPSSARAMSAGRCSTGHGTIISASRARRITCIRASSRDTAASISPKGSTTAMSTTS
jgi:hypothetical protein